MTPAAVSALVESDLSPDRPTASSTGAKAVRDPCGVDAQALGLVSSFQHLTEIKSPVSQLTASCRGASRLSTLVQHAIACCHGNCCPSGRAAGRKTSKPGPSPADPPPEPAVHMRHLATGCRVPVSSAGRRERSGSVGGCLGSLLSQTLPSSCNDTVTAVTFRRL